MNTDSMIIDWSIASKIGIVNEILYDWTVLLNDQKKKERYYHDFIKMNPFFLLTHDDCYLSISKLKLGSDYETDFVNLYEGYSDGNIYELVEIESPHTKLFDKKGNLTAKFNSALQQIRDWRRWLIDNQSGFKRLLPTTSTRVIRKSRLKFKIVIGRREDNEETLAKRRQISEENNIEIVSFDRLTDNLKRKSQYLFTEPPVIDFDIGRQSPYEKNQLANPFYTCLTHSEWKEFVKNATFHFYSSSIDEVLKYRKYNSYHQKIIGHVTKAMRS
ncbi:MAG: Shedu anti-phage system protein SduA domain-containing protein [Bacteroidota bacterium]